MFTSRSNIIATHTTVIYMELLSMVDQVCNKVQRHTSNITFQIMELRCNTIKIYSHISASMFQYPQNYSISINFYQKNYNELSILKLINIIMILIAYKTASRRYLIS